MRIDLDAIHRVMQQQIAEGSPDVTTGRLDVDKDPILQEFETIYGELGGPIVGFICVGIDLGIEKAQDQGKAKQHPDPESDHGHEDEFLQSLPEYDGHTQGD